MVYVETARPNVITLKLGYCSPQSLSRFPYPSWPHRSPTGFDNAVEGKQFGWWGEKVYFPIWYPALIFALAGISVLYFHRQFSIRSAMVATTIVAALIGMVAIL